MPIATQCPGCQTSLKVPDTLAGRRVKCVKCGASLQVPGGDGITTRKRTTARISDTPPAKKSHVGVALLAVGVVAVLLMCVAVPAIGAVGWWLLRPAPVAQVTPPPDRSPFEAG